MFTKKRIAFSRREIFGTRFQALINECFCSVSKMLFNDKINIDGTIDLNHAIDLKKEELWGYIYYLYFYNHSHINVFKNMKNKKDGKASAELFYSVVVSLSNLDEDIDTSKPALPIDNPTLITFINQVVEENLQTIVNPVIDYLNVLIKKNIVTRLAGLTIKTSDNNSDNKLEFVTKKENVDKANVKVKLSYNSFK